MASIWFLIAVIAILVILFGGGIVYQLVNALVGIIVLLILVALALYIFRRI